MANDIKKYKKENLLGPVFPCACCHTYKFREQVVELTTKQAAKIEKCAKEAFLKEQAAKQRTGRQNNQMTREEMEEANRKNYEEFLRSKYTTLYKGKGTNPDDSDPGELSESDLSDLEEEVNWLSVRPGWLAKWALNMKQAFGQNREVIDWNLEKGTRPEERETRRSLKKFRKYLDRDWLLLQKEMKDREGMTWLECREKEDKEYVKRMTDYYEESVRENQSHPIFQRLCYSCHNP